MKLELKRIRRDGGTQPRAKLSEETIEDYAEDMRNGDVFRPITVFFDGADYWLADGFHRVEAVLRLEPDGSIDADVEQGTLADAQWHSCGANKTHGLRRTNADKDRSVSLALVHENSAGRSNYEIAEHCGVSEITVRRHRQRLEPTTTVSQSNTPTPAGASESEVENGEIATTTVSQSRLSADPPSQLELTGEESASVQPRPRKGRDGRTINTAKIGKNSSGRRRRREVKISDKAAKPIRGLSLPNPMIPLQFSPNNARTAAATLYREFSRDWCESLIQELTRFLSPQGGQA